ncbi:2-dehydropantoate 2-reductase [Chitinivorax sp. PXF-14]|uniref:ketopantoate reductase family protein n=1 Tax=Chitinivorax sp. PXF-14 TaxID=3230488 RepID=UPI003465B830
MRIAIMGSGGVGGYFGARLAAAGCDVHFIARGAHLQAMRQHGLKVSSRLGDVIIKPAAVSDDPASIGPVDYVLFAVKLWDAEVAARACAPLVSGSTTVIPFLNGVETPALLARVLGAQHVVGGVAYIASTIAEPGHVEHTGEFAKLRFGELDGGRSLRLERLRETCLQAGIDGDIATDIYRALWEKYVFLASLSGWTSVTRQPIGPIRHEPAIRPLLEAAMQETWALGRAMGVKLADDCVARQMATIDALPAEMKSSMLHDLEHGRRLEAPWLCGGVARLARENGLSVPVNATLYAALKPYCGD